ncbi:hypothetical protein F4804DRAFT_328394 [Jackrogersella minutella]|nr:hypothetical protein F4804DRAFT_328394 [Jackrogersella minutella]
MDNDSDTHPLSIDSSPDNSTSAGDGDLTPTHTTTSDDPFTLPDYHSVFQNLKETVPWPGNTYIIRDPDSRRQITLVRGELRLEFHTGEQGGYHWVCVEKDGWLGFYDPVHFMHMGRDNRGGYIAQVKHHRAYEYFNVRRHPNGGYILLTQSWSKLFKMGIAKPGHRLVETEGEGTAWEFENVSKPEAKVY